MTNTDKGSEQILEDIGWDYFWYSWVWQTDQYTNIAAAKHLYTKFSRHKDLVDKFFLQISKEHLAR